MSCTHFNALDLLELSEYSQHIDVVDSLYFVASEVDEVELCGVLLDHSVKASAKVFERNYFKDVKEV